MVHRPDTGGEPDSLRRSDGQRGVEDDEVRAHGGVPEAFLMLRACVRGAGEWGVLASREGGGDVDDGDGARLGVQRLVINGQFGEVVDSKSIVCQCLRSFLSAFPGWSGIGYVRRI